MSAVDDGAQDLSAEERALAEALAREVVARGLAVPVGLLLEGVTPMNFVLSQALAFFSPVIRIVCEQPKFAQFQEMLEKRATIPYILKAIQQLEEARRG
jgi:hypothetical protein